MAEKLADVIAERDDLRARLKRLADWERRMDAAPVPEPQYWFCTWEQWQASAFVEPSKTIESSCYDQHPFILMTKIRARKYVRSVTLLSYRPITAAEYKLAEEHGPV